MKKKGFTLIELLVVIAIIAMLMAILMPALGKVKRMAERIVCGSNLRGLGNSIAVYATDYDDEYPVHLQGSGSQWRYKRYRWYNPQYSQQDLANDNNPVSVSGSLYLLVREADVDPKVFVCKSADEQAYEGQPEGDSPNPLDIDLVEMWDFGNDPADNVSYSYQFPYSLPDARARPASGSSDPSMAVMADKNPWCDDTLSYNASADQENYMSSVASWDTLGVDISSEQALDSLPRWAVQVNNSGNHQREGQNVLFNDMHVTFEKRADVGVRQDNIWMRPLDEQNPNASVIDRRIGTKAGSPDALMNHAFKGAPIDREDNALMSDPLAQ